VTVAVGPRDHEETSSGAAIYVADVHLPGELHAAVARSWIPHARIVAIDKTHALSMPGVVSVLTAADLPPGVGPIAVRLRDEAMRGYLQPVLATDRVRYVGEPVAFVIAESRRLAEDGADAIELDVEQLPPVVSATRAAGETPLFEDGHIAASVEVAVGDVETALASAEVVVQRSFRVARQTGMPIETRGVVASWEADRLCLWGPTKLPHYTRRVIAEALGLDVGKVRVREVRAGGGFGIRGELYPEDILAAVATMSLGRPVRWIEDRHEHMLASNHSREQEWNVRIGLDRQGRITGLDATFVNDMGAYIRTHGTVVPRLAATEFTGPYLVRNYRCRFEAVMTNKTPSGTMRSPGRYEATFVRERLLDIAAGELSIDPVELRRRNLVPAALMPFDTGIHLDGLDVVFDSGDFAEVLDLAESAGHAQHAKLVAAAGGRRLGFGLAMYSEGTGHGPAESAALTVLPSGNLEVQTGAPSLGQGHETVFAEVAAAGAAWPVERVHVIALDTDSLTAGGGTWASRGGPVAAAAVQLAATALRELIVGTAAELLGCSIAEVRVGPDGAAGGGREVSLADLCRAGGSESGIRVERSFHPRGPAFAYGATAATVAVDAATGGVDVLGMVVVAEVGRALNRDIVHGQIQGAAVQGIGGALLERLVYGEDGQPLTTTFVDYLLPSAADVPTVEVLLLENHPSPVTPLGAKGAGEIGILGSAPAIVNAVVATLGSATVELNEIPLTAELVARAAEQTDR
jgi:carbon-monoxide dehydrogenase large subunit